MKITSTSIPPEFQEFLSNSKEYQVHGKVHGCNLVYVVDETNTRRVINLDKNYYGDWRVVG